MFDQQAEKYGKPAAYDEVKRLIDNARQHTAGKATIYITGQPLYDAGQTCTLAGSNGPQLTDSVAKQAAADAPQNVNYLDAFVLYNGKVADGCHANTAGQSSLGKQA
ncbi:hypothetical protein diail_425, partial [Diaporthe ilicicola]